MAKQFTEKELKCIARHLQQYRRVFHLHEVDAPDACYNCDQDQAHECLATADHYYWFKLFCDISDITGINIFEPYHLPTEPVKGLNDAPNV